MQDVIFAMTTATKWKYRILAFAVEDLISYKLNEQQTKISKAD